jgi:hypothetical protein
MCKHENRQLTHYYKVQNEDDIFGVERITSQFWNPRRHLRFFHFMSVPREFFIQYVVCTRIIIQ